MLQVIHSLIPKRQCTIAVSGGKDSMTFLRFLELFRKEITVLHFNHGTEHGAEAEKFISDYCSKHNHELIIGKISREREIVESKEEYWRKERYKFFNVFYNEKVITCHHLNDCIETWIFGCANGVPTIIPPIRDHYIRPFLTVRKKDIDLFADRHGVEWVEDLSNVDTSYNRNYIRHNVMPHIKKVNPGIETVIYKKILQKLI